MHGPEGCRATLSVIDASSTETVERIGSGMFDDALDMGDEDLETGAAQVEEAEVREKEERSWKAELWSWAGSSWQVEKRD